MPFVGDDKDQYLSCNNVDEGSCHQGRWKSINNNPSTWGHPEDQISFDKRKRKRERKNISLCFSVISINAFPSIIDVVSLFLSLSLERDRKSETSPTRSTWALHTVWPDWDIFEAPGTISILTKVAKYFTLWAIFWESYPFKWNTPWLLIELMLGKIGYFYSNIWAHCLHTFLRLDLLLEIKRRAQKGQSLNVCHCVTFSQPRPKVLARELFRKRRCTTISAHWSWGKIFFNMSVVVVKWSACFPTIRVRIPLKSAIFL